MTAIVLSCTVTKIINFCILRKKSIWLSKSGGKTIFGKQLQMALLIPCGSKISSKSLYLAPFPRKTHFCILHRNLRWLSKIAENDFWEKIAEDSVNTHVVGQKFCQNHSITHHFRDKRVFAFYTEIQDGRQKWRENDFWDTVAEDSVHTLWVKNFVKITLSRTISEKNAFLYFTQKFNMAVKNGWKTIFGKKLHVTLHIPSVAQKI